MAQTDALGSGPISFFTDQGKQIDILLSDVYFDNAQVATKRAVDALSPAIDLWLKFLAAQGRITPGTAKPIPPSMVITAANPGTIGNGTTITVAPKTATTVDVTASKTERYQGLTRATIDGILGKTGGPTGTRPGLLRVKVNVAGGPDPAAAVNIAAMAGPKWRIAGGAADELTLEPNTPAALAGGDAPVAADFTVSIADVAAGAFTLVVAWTRTVPDVAAAALPGALAALYPVKITAPAGGAFQLPMVGTIVLGGGSETIDATSANATALAKV